MTGIRALAGLAALVAGAAAAQEGPSFDCARAEGAAQGLVCSDAGLAALDRAMAGRYAAALAAARGLGAGAEDAAATLRAEQRGWIKGRDDCWKADDLRACVEDAYTRRDGLLAARWLLESPSATAVWTCGGNPADEIATTFFDTPRPSLRLERGDRTEVAVLAPAASGARYEGEFGVQFWEKGGEATIDWVGGERLTCVRR
jgi:uncharacterized protein